MALKSSVHIETCLQDERTILKKSFCDAPFKLANVTEDKRQKRLQLMLMSSSPGMLDEDEYNFQIRLGEGTATTLQTQSYQRIFQMKNGAVQNMNVKLEAGASLVYLPHPTVPHKGSRFTSRNKIYLTDDCSLLWGEVISCGRKLNDEIFQFDSYHGLTEIFLNQRLVVKENLFLEPSTMNLHGLGQMEGYTHSANLLYLNEAAAVDEIMQSIAEDLQKEKGLSFGISSLPVNGFVVRLLGHKAEHLFALLKYIATSIESLNMIVQKTKNHV